MSKNPVSAVAAICLGLMFSLSAGAADRLPDYALRLGEISFDPLHDAIDVPVELSGGRADGPDLRLVQFTGPTEANWLAQLEDAGLEIVQYIHPYTYIVWGELGGLDAAMDNAAVRWTGDFAPAFRVLPDFRELGRDVIDVSVLLYRGADTEETVRAIEDLGGFALGQRTLNRAFDNARFAIAGSVLPDIAAIPGVYAVKPVPTDGGLRGEMSDQVNVGNYNGSNQAFPGYMDWINTVGVDGNGVIIANVDGGIQDNHPDLASRIVSCVGQTCGGSAVSGHGTHTAGIMAADGASGTLDPYGFLRALGVAPGADLVEQVYSPWYTQPGGMLLLMTDSYANGASLSGNSWGPSGSPQGYDDDTMQVDIGVRDTDPNTPGDQPLSFVLSFMNGYGGTSSQGTPDEAKNLFNIGSTKMQEGNGAQILDINDLSANTAHGPALDGRTIPHLVAPGCEVDSSTSGSGYTLLCGTSMASPHVSGAVALFIEYYRNRPTYTVDPSPALVKAAFLPVAYDLAGNLDADGNILGHPFDSKQGWGRMNIPAVVDPPDLSVRYFDQEVVFDNTGEEWSISLSPLDPSQPVKLMLVWTDAPGHGLGGSTPAWNNDLDLVVEVGGNTYYGNNFGLDGYSVTGGTADFMNNTEGVFLGPIPPGAFNVRIVASNINSDGLPNSGDTTDQDFALVAYNVAEEPGFMVLATPGDQAVCAPDDAVYTVELTQILGYSEAVTLSAAGHPAGTTVTFLSNPVVPPATTTMIVSDTNAAAAGEYTIEITGTAPDLTRSTSVGMSLSTAIPAMPSLMSPANGAVDVSIVPTFEWSSAAQAASYNLEVATDPGFANIVYSTMTGETTHATQTALATTTQYYWRVGGSNVCGDGAYSDTFTFTTQDAPAVLLVDDDDNSPDVRSYYTDMLDAMGIWYDVWDTNNSDDEPSAQELAQYSVVIWFTGDEFGGACGPGSAGEAALATWLDSGGCFLISSQDYHYDRDLTAFMQDYLGVASVVDDESQTTVTGTGSVFGEMGTLGLIYPFSNWSDVVNADGTAEMAFDGNAGSAAVNKDGGAYRTAFLGFPLEAIGDLNDRIAVTQAFLNACAGPNPCPADVNTDGTVDVLDLLEVLAEWGNSGVPADINADGVVDVLDLLEVLASWGPC